MACTVNKTLICLNFDIFYENLCILKKNLFQLTVILLGGDKLDMIFLLGYYLERNKQHSFMI